MVCLQTTHCAILLSLLGGERERVTEYSAPQWGQKKVPPSGTGPDRGTSAPPYIPNQYAPQREQIPAPSSSPRHQPTIIGPRQWPCSAKERILFPHPLQRRRVAPAGFHQAAASEDTRPNTITSAGVPQLLFFLQPGALPAANAVTTRSGGVRGSARPRASRPFRMRSAAFQM
jgi:hypothetical protein